MLLSEARPRPYRQPKEQRGYNQEEVDKQYFDDLKTRAEWNAVHGKEFVDHYQYSFDHPEVIAKNPARTVRAALMNVIRDGFNDYYSAHATSMTKDEAMRVCVSDSYYDSVHVGISIEDEVDIHRPIEERFWTNVGEFSVRGAPGETIVYISKDPYTGKDISDALFSVMSSDAGPQYQKVLKMMQIYAYTDSEDATVNGFTNERQWILEDPETVKLFELMSAELDKKVIPLIEDTRKKLQSLRVYVSQHVKDLYKSKK